MAIETTLSVLNVSGKADPLPTVTKSARIKKLLLCHKVKSYADKQEVVRLGVEWEVCTLRLSTNATLCLD